MQFRDKSTSRIALLVALIAVAVVAAAVIFGPGEPADSGAAAALLAVGLGSGA